MEDSDIKGTIFEFIEKARWPKTNQDNYAILDFDEKFLCKEALSKMIEDDKAANIKVKLIDQTNISAEIFNQPK